MDNPYILVLIAIITSVPPSLVAWLSYKKGRENAKAIQEIHISINSRVDQLLALTQKSAFAEGINHQKENTST